MPTITIALPSYVTELQAEPFPASATSEVATTASLTAGAGSIVVAATGGAWCWRFTECGPGYRKTRFCATLADATYAALVDLDPGTLVAAVEPADPAWEATVATLSAGKVTKGDYWVNLRGAGCALDGVTDDSVAFRAALAAIPAPAGNNPGGATLFLPPNSVLLLNTPSSGALATLSGKTNVTMMGVGASSRIRTTTAVATELLRVDGCQHFQMRDLVVQVQGTAKIDKAVHYTCPPATSSHNGRFKNVIISSSATFRKAYDIATTGGSPTIYSSQAAFVSGDVGGVVTLDLTTGPFYSSIVSTAQFAGTLASSMNTSTTTLTLNSALSGAPASGFTVKVGNERMLVTTGGNTTTLTVSRARGVDGIVETHAAGDAVTTSSATLATNAPITAPTATVPARIQPGGQPVMKTGLAIGTDNPGVSSMDLAGGAYEGVKIGGAAYAGLEVGNGTSGNILEHWVENITIDTSAYAILMNYAALSGDHLNLSTNLVELYRWGVSSSPVHFETVRSEGAARFYDMVGQATSGQTTTFEGVEIVTCNAEDGIVFRHLNSGSVLLQNINTNTSLTNAGLLLYQIAGTSTNPCHLVAINVATSGGSSDPFSASTAPTCIKTVFSVPRLAPGTGVVTPNAVVGMTLGQRLKLEAGFIRARRAVADQNTTVTTADSTVAYSSLTAARVVTLPAQGSAMPAGQEFLIKDESGACNGTRTITITPPAGTLDGAASLVLNTAYARAAVYTDGSNWFTR